MLKNRNIPFGYCMVNGEYALNAPEAEAVRTIFAEYISGKSLKAIASEMQIPYNTGKALWNKNMVCRVLENRKYIGENGYPQIITAEDFEKAAQIKQSRRTNSFMAKKQDNNAVNEPLQIHTAYKPTAEIEHITSQINRLLETDGSDRNTVSELIIKCAQLKFSEIREVR